LGPVKARAAAGSRAPAFACKEQCRAPLRRYRIAREKQQAAGSSSLSPCFSGGSGDRSYIGVAAGLACLPDGRLQTATESWRGGGESAMVVHARIPKPRW
jgi:hypothetical protein